MQAAISGHFEIPAAVRHVSFRGLHAWGLPYIVVARDMPLPKGLRGFGVNRMPDLPDYHVTVINIPPWALKTFLWLVALAVAVQAAGFVYLGERLGARR